MLKKIIQIGIASLLLPLAAIAEPDAITPFYFTASMATGAVAEVVTNAGPIYGYVEVVEVEMSTGATVDVSLQTVASSATDVTLTILSADDVATSAAYRPREPVHSTTGTALGLGTNGYERILLVGELLKCTITDASRTNIDVQVRVKLWR